MIINYCEKYGKVSYSKKDALTKKNQRRAKGAMLRVYQCPECNYWHLTHSVGGKKFYKRK